ncbi:deoxycytidylate deaminase-like [Mercenaria mercenaria]|uniref:deoxycytidylate deaminase-like n=1 Tax=Mercenaria mercenaria TaxID=6596 RepID=UPI00234EAA43|nr:deoxycytidylate deaminase-like [Mercenaria mercenaria]XP_053399603.1 deoxycytidylate deaminase-like [Mercenaria mercenaria]
MPPKRKQTRTPNAAGHSSPKRSKTSPSLISKDGSGRRNTSSAATKLPSCTGKSKNKKRSNYLNWEEYFMGIALITAQRSKDPNRQVGSCIVNAEKRIIGTGYNGMPNGCSDDVLPWGKNSPEKLKNKDYYVCHSEMNAIVNKMSSDVRGSTIYVTYFPCNECAKLLIQAGIKQVVYYEDNYKEVSEASRKMLKMARVKTKKYKPTGRTLKIGGIVGKFKL